MDLKAFVGITRAPFLILGPACVLVGLGTAAWMGAHIGVLEVVLLMIGGICTHISVNSHNEYVDFKTGLDSRTVRTPFSGGSGTLQARPEVAPYALGISIGAAAIAGLIGLYFAAVHGLAIIPLGIVGLIVIFAYTPLVSRNAVLNLLWPGLGFGVLIVVGTNVALTGKLTPAALIASLVPFFLVNNLLLLNQFPDVDADRSVGKQHFPLLLGRQASAYIYGAFLLLTYLAIALGVALAYLPAAALLGLLTAPLAVRAVRGAIEHADDLPRLIPSMGLNVLVVVLTPVLLSVGLMVS